MLMAFLPAETPESRAARLAYNQRGGPEGVAAARSAVMRALCRQEGPSTALGSLTAGLEALGFREAASRRLVLPLCSGTPWPVARPPSRHGVSEPRAPLQLQRFGKCAALCHVQVMLTLPSGPVCVELDREQVCEPPASSAGRTRGQICAQAPPPHEAWSSDRERGKRMGPPCPHFQRAEQGASVRSSSSPLSPRAAASLPCVYARRRRR